MLGHFSTRALHPLHQLTMSNFKSHWLELRHRLCGGANRDPINVLRTETAATIGHVTLITWQLCSHRCHVIQFALWTAVGQLTKYSPLRAHTLTHRLTLSSYSITLSGKAGSQKERKNTQSSQQKDISYTQLSTDRMRWKPQEQTQVSQIARDHKSNLRSNCAACSTWWTSQSSNKPLKAAWPKARCYNHSDICAQQTKDICLKLLYRRYDAGSEQAKKSPLYASDYC